MLVKITKLSQEDMKKICKKTGECGNCPLNTYIGCFYDFKLNGYLDIFIDTKTLKRYAIKDKSE